MRMPANIKELVSLDLTSEKLHAPRPKSKKLSNNSIDISRLNVYHRRSYMHCCKFYITETGKKIKVASRHVPALPMAGREFVCIRCEDCNGRKELTKQEMINLGL